MDSKCQVVAAIEVFEIGKCVETEQMHRGNHRDKWWSSGYLYRLFMTARYMPRAESTRLIKNEIEM